MPVTLPGIVHRFEAGHTMRLVVSSTDQAFALPAEPAVYSVGLAAGSRGRPADLAVPAGRAAATQADAGTSRWWVLLGVLAGLAAARLGASRCCGAGAAAAGSRPSSPTARTCRCASRA